MAAKKKNSEKKSGKKSTVKKATAKKAGKKSDRGKLAPRKQQRGLNASEIVLGVDASEVKTLVDEVQAAGGAAIGAYREPLSGRPILVASLPIASVLPTPFQRDLSPTHTKRLAEKIEESGSFLDPLIVVRGENGQLWTPNGRHRLAAAKVLGLRLITAIVSPDEDLAFRILALNTEKAHNLKDRSLEVIRMARNLSKRRPRDKENSYQAEFESAQLITLGIVYEQNKRFAGGAYSPMLKKVDRFSDKTLAASLKQRESYASRLLEIDAQVKDIIAELQDRGFKSPYLRTYVVARINPVRFHRAKKGDDSPAMAITAALTRMAAAAKKFNPETVKPGELAIVAAMAGNDE
ncbi:MAG TPA: ParB/RepB/Spo0J family partition protein [Methylotenera sp.]|nr:ParB/RepB/Spo0J family partition protein [Methylotenera sp.]